MSEADTDPESIARSLMRALRGERSWAYAIVPASGDPYGVDVIAAVRGGRAVAFRVDRRTMDLAFLARAIAAARSGINGGGD